MKVLENSNVRSKIDIVDAANVIVIIPKVNGEWLNDRIFDYASVTYIDLDLVLSLSADNLNMSADMLLSLVLSLGNMMTWRIQKYQEFKVYFVGRMFILCHRAKDMISNAELSAIWVWLYDTLKEMYCSNDVDQLDRIARLVNDKIGLCYYINMLEYKSALKKGV